MTISSMPALQESTPREQRLRAALAALACFAGGALWVLAETGDGALGPLSGFEVQTAAVAPRAWALDMSEWTGLAGMASSIGTGAAMALRAVAILLLAAAALGVIHPGVYQRPAPYALPPLRRAIAFTTSFLIGMALPAVLLALTSALTHEPRAGVTAMDSTVTLRVLLGTSIFCAILWALAGRGVLNPRALVRFAHGGVAGVGIFGALGIAAVASRPLIELAALSRAGNVFSAADAGAGAAGATFGWMLGATMVLYGLGCAVAGAVAVTGAPQSVGQWPRRGSAAVAIVGLALLVAAGLVIERGAERRAADAAPDLVAELGLATSAPARPVVLLNGEGAIRVPPRGALAPVELAGDCAPPGLDAVRALPAATEDNAAKLRAYRERLGNEISGRAARALGCEAAIRARLFEPDEARRLLFTDPERSRIGYAGFRIGVRGLLENVSTQRSRALLGQLADTTRYATTPQIRRRIAALAAAPPDQPASVHGELAVVRPERWRIGIISAGDSTRRLSPWVTAPRTDGQVLEWMAAAVAPDSTGTFVFTGLAPGAYRLALLAPEGLTSEALSIARVAGDPGRFELRPGAVLVLGPVSLR